MRPWARLGAACLAALLLLSAEPGPMRPSPRPSHPPVALQGTNLFDVAASSGATIWDTLNSSAGAPTNTAVVPCYAAGSPLDGYLGGNMAYGMSAWGSAAGAEAVTAAPQMGQTPNCVFRASGAGASWSVDLRFALKLATVVIRAHGDGVSGATISVGNEPGGGSACATGVVVAAGAQAGFACAGQGRYLTIAGARLDLCSVQVFPEGALCCDVLCCAAARACMEHRGPSLSPPRSQRCGSAAAAAVCWSPPPLCLLLPAPAARPGSA